MEKGTFHFQLRLAMAVFEGGLILNRAKYQLLERFRHTSDMDDDGFSTVRKGKRPLRTITDEVVPAWLSMFPGIDVRQFLHTTSPQHYLSQKCACTPGDTQVGTLPIRPAATCLHHAKVFCKFRIKRKLFQTFVDKGRGCQVLCHHAISRKGYSYCPK